MVVLAKAIYLHDVREFSWCSRVFLVPILKMRHQVPHTLRSRSFHRLGTATSGFTEVISSDPPYLPGLHKITKSRRCWRPVGSGQCSERKASFSPLCVLKPKGNDLYMSVGRQGRLTFHLWLDTSLAIGLVNQPLASLNKSKENRPRVTGLKKEPAVDLLAHPPCGVRRSSEQPGGCVDTLGGNWV